MTTTRINNIAITGIVSVIPAVEKVNTAGLSGVELQDMQRIVSATGIQSRRIVAKNQTSLDLSVIAGKQLIEDMDWQEQDIALLIFVTQTPDYPFPGNAIQLQNKLGLSKSTLAFDVNLGCSGFVYGLWQLCQLLKGLDGNKALLVVGDTTSQQCSESSRTVAPLFGDALSIIAVEKSEQAGEMVFSLGSDGSGAPYLIQPNGGSKAPEKQADLFMDGTQVFVFTLREVPKSITACLVAKNWKIEEVDYCVMHQANEMMLKHLGDKLGVSARQLIISMADVGNTSSASIPLALCLSLSKELTTAPQKIIVSGFGVGWSWASAAMTIGPLKTCRLIDLL
ncbi:MAG: ketoacyl-ACP synthase III [Psychrobium sp.]|nr:ketoacyl-ACP synthase III [Psychrobium sp.]